MKDDLPGYLVFDADDVSFAFVSNLQNEFTSVLMQKNIVNHSRLMIHAGKSLFSALVLKSAFDLKIPYVPVDAAFPVARVKQLFELVVPHFIFIDRNTQFYKEFLQLQSHTILWSKENLLLVHMEGNRIGHDTELACILFTSGSTGVPKGVMISRNNISTFVNWTTNFFSIDEASRILSVAPFHFDLSLFDVFSAFGKKAKLLIPEQNFIPNPLFLAQYIFDNKINTIYATPSWYSLLLQYGKMHRYDFYFVKNILVAGEAFKVTLAQQLHSVFPNASIANLYGPTETNVCTAYKIDFGLPVKQKNGIVSIGKACPYANVKINDEGILLVSGQSVMMGYWPHVKSEAFYNTGDVAAQDENGLFYFISRADNMIKRNGYRIEPGDIEACLSKVEHVEQVLVTSATQNDQVVITAHILTHHPETLSFLALKDFCFQCLPVYMVPDAFKIHTEFPLTSTGKIDYQKLS